MGSEEPASYLTLEPGADVYSSDGQRIGTVEHVLRDEESDIFDGLVIDVRLGPGGRRFVDAPEVGEIRADGVAVAVAAADVDRLPEPFRTASHFNPFFYLIDGFRYGFIGHADGSVAIGVAATLVLNVVLFFCCWTLFRTGWRLKS